MIYTKHQQEYIDALGGDAHQAAIEIIGRIDIEIKIVQIIEIKGDIVGLLSNGSLVFWSETARNWSPYLPAYVPEYRYTN